MLINILKRVAGMLLRPNEEWLAIKNEPFYDHSELARDFALPVIFACIFIMLSLIGVSKRGVFFAIAAFVLTFVNLSLTSGFVLQAARKFSPSADMVSATKLVVFSSIPFWLSFTFLSTHSFGLLASLLGTGYSVLLARLGLPSVMNLAEEHKSKLFGACALIMFLLNFISVSILIAIRRLVLPSF